MTPLRAAPTLEAYLGVPDILEILAGLAGDADSHREAARLFGAAEGIRQRTGEVRFADLPSRIRGVGGGASKCHGREGLRSGLG